MDSAMTFLQLPASLPQLLSDRVTPSFSPRSHLPCYNQYVLVLVCHVRWSRDASHLAHSDVLITS